MSESLQKNRLYEYKANSNLVLEAERDKRRRDEGTTEVESLHGRLEGIKMGDRNFRSSLIPEKAPKRAKALSLEPELNGKSTDVYKPKIKESRVAYDEILGMITLSLGDQPRDILVGAADEVIALLQSNLKESMKLEECKAILGKLGSDEFSKLLLLARKLSDFSPDSVNDNEGPNAIDDEIGVAVVFDDDDQVFEDADDADMAAEDKNLDEVFVTQQKREDAQVSGKSTTQTLSPTDIDAHWLQRQVSKFIADANASSKMSEDILDILSGNDHRSMENALVLLLQFERFDFMKLLLQNRDVVYFCTKYRQAQTSTDKEVIENEMLLDETGMGKSIFALLNEKTSSSNWTQHRLGEYSSNRKETNTVALHSDNGPNSLITNDVDSSFTTSGLSRTYHGKVSLLDLDSLQFSNGGHFMSNEQCELPSKSWRALKKGYEEVHVPAIRPVIPAGEVLTPISLLPSWCQPAFPDMKHLNRIQSKMLNSTLYGSENILLCAPTGSGKTNVATLCILNQIGKHRNDDGSIDLDKFKIVYIAPMKALVQECVQNFSKKLSSYGMQVNELSGDQNLSKQQLQSTNVIVTTPEKWDIITRKSGDKSVISLVRLIIIDEVHLLHDDRGPVLEAIVSRTLKYVETNQEMIRLVGLSATLPNYEDVAAFLRVNPERGLFYFDNSYRPVPLQQQYIGITEKKAFNRYKLMNEICYEKVLQNAGKNQVLIFTHSRADTVKTAKALLDLAIENDRTSDFVPVDSASKEILREESSSTVKNSDLKDLLPYGFAVHHAGLLRSDRSLVEDLFSDKHIQVLVSTATLAWGVNLPCHTVIIKGTQIYSPEKGQWVEMSPLDTMQMIGRAGRYGLDSEGEGIILTNHNELQFYLSLLNQQLPVESQMIKKLPDMVNAEIVLGNISTVNEAIEWLGYTFLYVRMLRNPDLYGVPDLRSDPMLLDRRFNLIHTSLTILEKHGLVKYDKHSGFVFSNPLGRIASYFYVNHDSIYLYNDFMKPDMTEIEIFRLFSLSHEFKNMFVRDEEKLELTKLLSRVPIPIKENVEEVSAKVNVLFQSYISRLRLEVRLSSFSFDINFHTFCVGLRVMCRYDFRATIGLSTSTCVIRNIVKKRMGELVNQTAQY
jgi:pre-mRNA-splicing helicase BRR2